MAGRTPSVNTRTNSKPGGRAGYASAAQAREAALGPTQAPLFLVRAVAVGSQGQGDESSKTDQ